MTLPSPSTAPVAICPPQPASMELAACALVQPLDTQRENIASTLLAAAAPVAECWAQTTAACAPRIDANTLAPFCAQLVGTGSFEVSRSVFVHVPLDRREA